MIINIIRIGKLEHITKSLKIKAQRYIDNDKNKFNTIVNDITIYPKTEKEILALDLAEQLGDKKNIKFYLWCTWRLNEIKLRRILGIVMETPNEKIKKSRGAYFAFLVKLEIKKSPTPTGEPNEKNNFLVR